MRRSLSCGRVSPWWLCAAAAETREARDVGTADEGTLQGHPVPTQCRQVQGSGRQRGRRPIWAPNRLQRATHMMSCALRNYSTRYETNFCGVIARWRRWGLLLIMAIRWPFSGTRDEIAVHSLPDSPLGPKIPRREAFIPRNGRVSHAPFCLQSMEMDGASAPTMAPTQVPSTQAADAQPKLLHMKQSDLPMGGYTIGAIVDAEHASAWDLAAWKQWMNQCQPKNIDSGRKHKGSGKHKAM